MRETLLIRGLLLKYMAMKLGVFENWRKVKMSEWTRGARLMVLSCWILLFAVPAHAEPAEQVQELPASAVQAVPSPAEDFEAGVKADGKGDLIGALTLYKRAADAGYVPAQVRYADNLKRGQLTQAALKYYRMSAQGNRDGQYGLGALYEEGEGVKQNSAVARFLFEMAAEQGHRDASIRLAGAYLTGQASLDEAARQSPEALSAIRRAAGHDYLPALDALAVAYKEGKFGITPDPDQAEVIVAITNKMRGIVVKEKKKSALFKLLKGDSEKTVDNPKAGGQVNRGAK